MKEQSMLIQELEQKLKEEDSQINFLSEQIEELNRKIVQTEKKAFSKILKINEASDAKYQRLLFVTKMLLLIIFFLISTFVFVFFKIFLV